jgi:predicted RNase H-like nuclease (RuvC/YqgF family)
MKKEDELAKLRKDVEAYKSAGEELGNEVLKLKRQNAALRGYNGTLKKQIEAFDEKVTEQHVLIHQLNEENETLMKEIARLHEELKEEKKPWWKIF